MAIKFNRESELSRLLDRAKVFEESAFPTEFGIEPVTNDMGVVVEFQQSKSEGPELTRLVSESRQRVSPFHPKPTYQVTRKFLPDFCSEGRVNLNEAVVPPNAAPSMSRSALAVFSSQHFIGMTGFTDDILADAFVASQTYTSQGKESFLPLAQGAIGSFSQGLRECFG
jgi:hypothetical protein